MRILGITGLMGAGKTAVCRILKKSYGCPIFDADIESRKLLFMPKIRESISLTSHLPFNFSRDDLSIWIQKDQSRLKTIEAILHPLVERKLIHFIQRHRTLGSAIIALDVPLLFEVGWQKFCTDTILVEAHQNIRSQRLKKRGMSEADTNWRLSNQWDNSIKQKCAAYIIGTNIGYGYTFRQISTLMKILCVKSSLIPKQPASAFNRATVLSKLGA